MIEIEMGLGLLEWCYFSWVGQWMSLYWHLSRDLCEKWGVTCPIWEKNLPGRASSGPKVGGCLACARDIKEASMDIVQWARARVIEMRSKGAEGAKSWRVLEAVIRILGFILGEMKSHWSVFIGEVIIFKGSLWLLWEEYGREWVETGDLIEGKNPEERWWWLETW